MGEGYTEEEKKARLNSGQMINFANFFEGPMPLTRIERVRWSGSVVAQAAEMQAVSR